MLVKGATGVSPYPCDEPLTMICALTFFIRGMSWVAAHDDVIKWKHFPRYWPFVHKGQWRRALMFSLIFARINSWVNNRTAGDSRRNRDHYDVSIMWQRRPGPITPHIAYYYVQFNIVKHSVIVFERTYRLLVRLKPKCESQKSRFIKWTCLWRKLLINGQITNKCQCLTQLWWPFTLMLGSLDMER